MWPFGASVTSGQMVIDKPASVMVAPGLLEYLRAQWEHDNNRKMRPTEKVRQADRKGVNSDSDVCKSKMGEMNSLSGDTRE